MRHAIYCFFCLVVIGALISKVPAAAQTTPAASAAPSAAPSATPATSGAPGTIPIESTIFAYQGLSLGADEIAAAIHQRVQGDANPKIIIATPGDITAIVQLRLLLAQINIFNDRLTRINGRVARINCVQQHGGHFAVVALPALLAGVASSVSSLGSVLTTVASFTQVNETLTSEPASFLDSTLTDLVAQDVATRTSASVYLPSFAPPNLIATGPPSGQTYLFSALDTLDANRQTLEDTAERHLLTAACQKNATAIAATKLVNTALAATDKFQAGLFGIAGLPATGLIGATSAPPKNAPKPPSSSAAISNTITISSQKSASPAAGPSGPSAMERLFYIDLLLHQLNSSSAYLLAVHALEAGGSQISRFWLFTGTRPYFSGGAVAAFALLRSDGSIACSGIAYGYRGFVGADGFATVGRAVSSGDPVDPNKPPPYTQVYAPSCSPHAP